jgi:hypothetical protein
MQLVRDFTVSAVEAAVAGFQAAAWCLAWAIGFGVVVSILVASLGLMLDGAGLMPHYPSEGERVAECRMLPGFPNYDRNMRFVGCEAQ